MRWWPWRRRHGCPSQEARHSEWQAKRAYKDARVQREQAKDAHIRAAEVAAQLEETQRRNHFAEAVARSMRRA